MNNERTYAFTAAGLRVVLATILLAHGTQKAFGWFGGFGWEGTMGFFTNTLGVPYILGALVIIGETLGALMLLAGVLTRISAVAAILIMVGAIVLVHLPNGFYMNWYGSQAGEGYEMHLAVIAMAGVLVIHGPGKWSLDHVIRHRFISGK